MHLPTLVRPAFLQSCAVSSTALISVRACGGNVNLLQYKGWSVAEPVTPACGKLGREVLFVLLWTPFTWAPNSAPLPLLSNKMIQLAPCWHSNIFQVPRRVVALSS